MLTLTAQHFGMTLNRKEIKAYTLENQAGIKVKILNYGGIISELHVPNKDQQNVDVVLGFDSFLPYLNKHPYFGAIIGRYANRIAEGSFKIDKRTYRLTKNFGKHQLHGGVDGFDKKIWYAETFQSEQQVSLKLSYLSKHGEEGFPGNLAVTVMYSLNKNNELKISYQALTDKDTPVNLTNHSYFNLAGKGTILNQDIQIFSEAVLQTDQDLIPTGSILSVNNTHLDLRTPKNMGQLLQNQSFDHAYILSNSFKNMVLVAKAVCPENGIKMEVLSNKPSIQFYTPNFEQKIMGKNDQFYEGRAAFCLETQHYPDAPNHPSFPSALVTHEQNYEYATIYKFGIA